MKKFIALLLALTMLVAFAGCNNEPVDTKPVDTKPVETDPVETEPVETEPAVKVMTNEEFDAAELDSEVIVETYIQAVESWYNGNVQLYTQAEDGGYYIYNLACSEEDAAKLVPGTKIRVTGYKAEWSGEVEIIDATYEILDAEPKFFGATDVTALLGTDELIGHLNELVAMNGLTVTASKDANGNDVAFLYKWDGSGSRGSDLYFNVAAGEHEFTFTVNVYMVGTGVDSEVYQAVEALQIGDVINLEGFLYWYNGAQPHITSVTHAE